MPSISVYFATLVLLSFTIACEINHGCVHALEDGKGLVRHLRNNNSSVKTIESEDGDVIDCVDIYKQPAFDHPLLRNHTIQMRPTTFPNGKKVDSSVIKIKNVRCPEGTIPILRTQTNERKLGRKSSTFIGSTGDGHEHAVVLLSGNKYHGAHANINVWQPKVMTPTSAAEFSLSQIWVVSDNSENRATAEAGWMVSPRLFGDSQTRFFLYWTDDNYQKTGCYNLKCPGFVQTNKRFAPGSVIKPVSTYNGKQFDIFIAIFKDKANGNWWVQLQNEVLGYWPASILTHLANGASELSWGGEVLNTQDNGLHTTTQMGSGHFPSEGPGKSSFFRNLQVVDTNNNMANPVGIVPIVDKPKCYDVHITEKTDTSYGYHFYYGGPGFSQNCQ